MKSIITIIILLCVAYANNITIRDVKGRVNIFMNNKTVIATNNMVLKKGSIIKTFNRSSATIVMENGNIKKLKQRSSLTLNYSKGKGNIRSILLKLSSATTKSMVPQTVAGVRGSEQGKKGTFGVKWQSTKPSRANNSSLTYDRAMSSFNRGDYDKAKIGFNEYIKTTTSSTKEIKSLFHIALSEIELLEYNRAITTLNILKDKFPDKKMSSSILYYTAFCLFVTDNISRSKKYLNKYLKDNKGHYLYWDAKVLELMQCIGDNDIVQAKKIRNDISVNCKDENIHKNIMSMDI